MSRCELVGRLAALSTVLAVVLFTSVACAPQEPPPSPAPTPPVPNSEPVTDPPQSYYLPIRGSWELPEDIPSGRVPSEQGFIEIENLGIFSFDPLEVETLRPDIFSPGHFSIFDVVAHLADREWFTMTHHYNSRLDTHVIDELDGRMNWWYRAYYPGGWPEINAFRMDMFPYKDGTTIKLSTHTEEYVGRIYNSFAEEILRKSINVGRVVIPEVRIGTTVHTNVPVSAHNVRPDVLQPGTITALDVLLSLADQGKIDRMKLTWYPSIGEADPVDSLFVEQIDAGDGVYDLEASPELGKWVYETGSRDFGGFQGSHIQIPPDVRVIVSPEYMTWYWLA